MTTWERLKYAVVTPDDEPDHAKPTQDRTVEEIEEDIRRSNDKERAIGLAAGPIAAVIGLLIGGSSIDYARTHHESLATFETLTYVLLGLAVLILVTSMMRKRLFQGISLVLYGLAVFNLRYWGFGIPFVLAGAWYLVRAYRLQQELKRAEAESPGASRSKGGTTNGARPRPNKRYTPRA
jgi:Ca2+/Na+ antiporter